MAIDVVQHNPMMKKPVMCVLAAFEEQPSRLREEAEADIASAWDPKFAQGMGTTIDVLLRNGALEQAITVEGEPYEGTLEDLQLDEDVPLEAQVECRLTVTEEGARLAASLKPERTLADLVRQRPHYKDIYLRVLALCARPEGATRAQVEQVVEQDGDVMSTAGKRVYPQYFIDALETAGGIEWDGVWRATPAGEALVAPRD